MDGSVLSRCGSSDKDEQSFVVFSLPSDTFVNMSFISFSNQAVSRLFPITHAQIDNYLFIMLVG